MRTAKEERVGLRQRVARATNILTSRRAMTTAERHAIQHEAANDPGVERALREVLAARPELSSKTRA